MTLPQGYGSGGSQTGGRETRGDLLCIIGRTDERLEGIFSIGRGPPWAATAGGVYVGVTVYPWAYPLPSGLYALSVLTVIEALGFFFMWKIAHEKPVRA